MLLLPFRVTTDGLASPALLPLGLSGWPFKQEKRTGEKREGHKVFYKQIGR